MIPRREMEAADLASVLSRLRVFLATREDAWWYRGQMTLAVDGYNNDPRELVDIPEVRALLSGLEAEWPYWAFFFNQVDDSIKLLLSCVAGSRFLGRGAVETDADLVAAALARGFGGMNMIFDRFGFPEDELEKMSNGLVEVVLTAWAARWRAARIRPTTSAKAVTSSLTAESAPPVSVSRRVNGLALGFACPLVMLAPPPTRLRARPPCV
jgi:hypothetical protein